MRTRVLRLFLCAAALCCGGCMSGVRAKLEAAQKAAADGATVNVTVTTIYGVTGTLVETPEMSELRINSPVGSYHRTVKRAP